jgi:hypothetical protein
MEEGAISGAEQRMTPQYATRQALAELDRELDAPRLMALAIPMASRKRQLLRRPLAQAFEVPGGGEGEA